MEQEFDRALTTISQSLPKNELAEEEKSASDTSATYDPTLPPL